VVYDAAPYVAPSHFASATYDWSGHYAGVDAGYLWERGTATLNATFGDRAVSTNPEGWLLGGHVGFLKQTPRVVLGLEADAWGIGGASVNSPIPGTGNTNLYNLNWGGSLRGIVGLPFANNLIYATGGLALIDFNGCNTVFPHTSCFPGSSYGGTRAGWTVGIGAAHAFTPNLRLRVEYLCSDFGSQSYSTPVGNLITSTAALTTQAVRVGLSYRFGGHQAPISVGY
jgi:outer membrane immunogenic protein